MCGNDTSKIQFGPVQRDKNIGANGWTFFQVELHCPMNPNSAVSVARALSSRGEIVDHVRFLLKKQGDQLVVQ
jgi:hypothetical protein